MAMNLGDFKDQIILGVAGLLVLWMGYITTVVIALPEKQILLDHMTAQLLKESENQSESLKGMEDKIVSLKTQLLLLNEKHYREMLSLSLSNKVAPDHQMAPAPGETE